MDSENSSHAERSDQPHLVRQLGTTIGLGQLLILPLCLAAVFAADLDLDWPRRVRLAVQLWVLINVAIAAPLVLIAPFQKLFGFLLGPAEFRHRSVTLQFAAWTATVAFTVAGAAFIHFVGGKDIGESFGFMTFSTPVAGIGFYHLAMACMPAPFFEEDVVGSKVLKFLGCESPETAPLRCWLGGSAFVVIAIGIAATPYFVFVK